MAKTKQNKGDEEKMSTTKQAHTNSTTYIPLKGVKHRCSGKVNIYCSAIGNQGIIHVYNPMISHARGNDNYFVIQTTT